MKELLKYINLAKEAGCSIEFSYSNLSTQSEYFIVQIESRSFARGVSQKILIKDLENANDNSTFERIIINMIRQVNTW